MPPKARKPKGRGVGASTPSKQPEALLCPPAFTTMKHALLKNKAFFTDEEQQWLHDRMADFELVNGKTIVQVDEHGEHKVTAAAAHQTRLKNEFDLAFPYRNPQPKKGTTYDEKYLGLMCSLDDWAKIGSVRRDVFVAIVCLIICTAPLQLFKAAIKRQRSSQ